MLSIVSTLSKNIFLDKEELRDISGIGERKGRMCMHACMRLCVCVYIPKSIVCTYRCKLK